MQAFSSSLRVREPPSQSLSPETSPVHTPKSDTGWDGASQPSLKAHEKHILTSMQRPSLEVLEQDDEEEKPLQGLQKVVCAPWLCLHAIVLFLCLHFVPVSACAHIEHVTRAPSDRQT